MLFNRHSSLVVGAHAFLSPSNHHWINYDEDKLDRMFDVYMAARRGSDLHAFAHEAIRLGIRMPTSRRTLHLYVNDAIGFKMQCEQPLVYSENCYGTCDAIAFRRGVLRIHDLKTGVTPASMHQCILYAALFCLEYRMKPTEMKTELRIYQNDDFVVHEPEADELFHFMDRIVWADKRIKQMRAEAEA